MVVPEKTKKSTEVFDGCIMKVFKDEIFLGEKTAFREVVRHKGATAILAIDENGEAFCEYREHAGLRRLRRAAGLQAEQP